MLDCRYPLDILDVRQAIPMRQMVEADRVPFALHLNLAGRRKPAHSWHLLHRPQSRRPHRRMDDVATTRDGNSRALVRVMDMPFETQDRHRRNGRSRLSDRRGGYARGLPLPSKDQR